MSGFPPHLTPPHKGEGNPRTACGGRTGKTCRQEGWLRSSRGMADTTAPVLAIKNLSVELPPGSDRISAVDDIALSVGRGEIVCMVGESGSGKSVTAQTV